MIMFENTDPTRYVFRIHGVGRVKVEIGDVVRREGAVGRFDHRHSYPEYRVTVNDAAVMAGRDYGVPAGMATDGLDAAIDLLFWAAYEEGRRENERFGAELLDLWVHERLTIRDALRSSARNADPRVVVRAMYAGLR